MKREDNKKSSESLSEFLAFTRSVQSEHDHHFEEVNACDKETGDLKHQIELGSYKDRNRAATALKHVLQRRRVHKDYLAVNSELVEYLRSQDFVKVYRKLEQLLGTVRSQERYVESHRVYKPRSDSHTLTINTKQKEE